MTDKNKIAENRRKLLKSVAAGGGAIIAGKAIPESWVKPAVDSVVLPAHAQTSRGPFSGTQMASLDSDSLMARATDSLVPQAHAADLNYEVSWCITPTSDTTAKVRFMVTEDYGDNICDADLWTTETDVKVGELTDLTYSDACSNKGANAGEWLNQFGLVKDARASVSATVLLNGVATGDSFEFTRTEGSIEVTDTLSAGPCGPTSVECGPC